jgi:hypothetical protein
MNIPIAILIFDNNGQIYYKAFSPREYYFRPDGSNPDHRDGQFGQFLAHVYNRISYNELNPLNNSTNYGLLKEIHTRHITIPITSRENICYFSTYNHPHTSYKPVHINSPISFDSNWAQTYTNIPSNLSHQSCTHEFV